MDMNNITVITEGKALGEVEEGIGRGLTWGVNT